LHRYYVSSGAGVSFLLLRDMLAEAPFAFRPVSVEAFCPATVELADGDLLRYLGGRTSQPAQ
jgi:hypothetical protein